MQQQTITMLANISTSGGNNIDNDLQRSTGNGITSTTQAQIVTPEPILAHHNQDQLSHQNRHQFEQLQQPTTTQQQPPLQNGPKPRGRRKKIRTEPIRPICPQCEKQFSNQSALTKHKLTHSDERKYACQQCSKAFKRHDHLTGHMQTHSNRKPFNCTIQGCDKTYCDARSLRRHKENIHHIVTQTQEPSHLLRRRIQRLHSDQGLYNRSVEHHQLNCVTAPPHSLPPQTSLTPQQVSTTSTSTITPNGNSNHQSASYLNHHHGLAGQHGSFSADYASTQHFNFDFVPVNGGGQSGHHHGHHHHHHHQDHHPASHHDHHQDSYLEHHINGIEHTLNSGSVPHSADSVSDSGLGLNVRYEQHTPQPLAPPPPPPRLYNQQQHQQQAPHHVSYSAGYASTQHFDFDFVNHPDQGIYNRNIEHHQMNCVTAPPQNLPPQTTNLTPQQVATTPTTAQTPNGNSNSGNHQSASYINQNGHSGNHGSFSADYASTQHFNFDFVPVSGSANGIGQSAHNHHHYHHDRHPGSNQNHQNVYLNSHVTSLEHTLSTDSVPHSADSVTDSGLSLNVHYEQHMLQPQPRMREAYSN